MIPKAPNNLQGDTQFHHGMQGNTNKKIIYINTSELMAVAAMRQELPEHVKQSGNPFLVVFDRPSNKGNLGTLIRSCEAFGVDALLLTGHGVDMYDPEVVTATMGSFFRLPVTFSYSQSLSLFMSLS